jgi:CBS domain-containing protein
MSDSNPAGSGVAGGWPLTTVGQILDRKGREVWSVPPEATVLQALEIMDRKGAGALLVLEGDRVAGIFSERDYARKVPLKGGTPESTAVRDVMTRDVLCVAPDMTADRCLALMTEKRVRHLPVLCGGELAGLISIGDIVKEVITAQGFIISQLETYIKGR